MDAATKEAIEDAENFLNQIRGELNLTGKKSKKKKGLYIYWMLNRNYLFLQL